MKEYIHQLLENKKILLLGFGKEGESTYKLIRKYLPEKYIHIADMDEQIVNKYNFLGIDENVNLSLGKNYLNHINEFEIIIKTPGISLNNVKIDVNSNKITSQTSIFLSVYSEQIIGITGTKGKSTTSSLIYHIIHSFKQNTVLVGNIGIPPFEVLDNIDEDTTIVYELSSHQLEYISKSPHISILLNLFQEHLDHYKSYMDYQLSKYNITKYQTKGDYFICFEDDKLIKNLNDNNQAKTNILTYSLQNSIKNGAYLENKKIWYKNGKEFSMVYEISEKQYLKGDHNLLNIMAAIIACKLSNIPEEAINNGIIMFKGLMHRIEYVGQYKNIYFYNDSIATIPEATMEAVKTLKKVNTLILGGFDRGVDYRNLALFLAESDIQHFIFIEQAGIRIMDEMKRIERANNQNFYVVKTMKEAVDIAESKTKENSICLLSPAAASYGMFKNFEERGNIFKQLVRKIEHKNEEESN